MVGGRQLMRSMWPVAAVVAMLPSVGLSLATRHSPLATRHSPLAADTITVDARYPLRTLPATFFGINYVGFWDAHQGSAASAAALGRTPIRVVRFPGGDPGDWYDWRHPLDKGWSMTSPLALARYARSFGASVLFQTNAQGHAPLAHRGPAVNSPESAAAWVQYDRAHGIVAAMEVGNEEDITMHRAHDPSFAPYAALFNQQARAMHRANRAVTVFGPAGTNEYQWWALDSLGMFLRAAGDRFGSGQVDGVSLHFYKGASWDDTKGVPQYWLTGPWPYIKGAIRLYDRRALPVDISEWNLGGSGTNNPYNATLGHALVTADMIGAFALSGVAGEQYFDTHGANGWGLLYGDGEAAPRDSPTPTYYAMALWGAMGRTVLPLQEDDNPATTVSCYATRRPDGSLQVLAINKTGAPRAITVGFSGFNPRGKALRVYELRGATASVADRMARYDGVVMPHPTRTLPGPYAAGRVRGSALTATLAPYSAVVLDVSGRA